jgi:hypothetical protein
VLVMLEPGNDKAARRAGRSRLRASHADREQVIDILKDAFVEDRLTKDEFDARVSYALASRTHADLAALTADLPAGPLAAQAPRRPNKARPKNTTVKTGARVIAATTVLTGAVWAGGLQSQTDGQAWSALVWTFTFVWVGIVMLVGAVMIESRRQRRSDGQLPPTPGDRGQPFKRAISASRPLRPDDHGRPHVAEASRSRTPRLRLLPEPGPSPS